MRGAARGWILILAWGCHGKGDDSATRGGDDGASTLDADGDGYEAGPDCDDADESVHPGADEVCNGIDDDCEGTVDVGATDATALYADADGDGYGAGASTLSCTKITGSVDNDDDCDDTRADVSPVGQEVCDDADADEDCDGLADDADDSADAASKQIFHADMDGDGYGDSKATVMACDPGTGTVVDATDCDDAASTVNPGASEVCGNGVDDDCDGGPGSCAWVGDVEWDVDADTVIEGEIEGGYQGKGVRFAHDVDGDGNGDLLLCSGANAEEAYVVSGPVATMAISDATAVLTAEHADGDRLGNVGDALGDHDGDGYDDVVTTATSYPEWGAYGRAYLVAGPVSGTASAYDVSFATITGVVGSDFFGLAAAAGDVTGDGNPDMLIGSLSAAYLFDGPLPAGDWTTDDANGTFTGFSTYLSVAIAANGDIDGDGVDDLLISSEMADDGPGSTGIDWLFYGPVSGAHDVSEGDVEFHGADYGWRLGQATAIAGDVDGDGNPDVVLAGPGGETVVVVAASAVSVDDDIDIGTDALGSISDKELGAEFGTSVTSEGDLDGDGFADLVVGAPFEGPSDDGAAYVFAGPIVGSLSTTDAVLRVAGQPKSYENTGAFVAAGDLDADGYADAVIDHYAATTTPKSKWLSQGAVSVWYGGAL
jgi:hypothetical protein